MTERYNIYTLNTVTTEKIEKMTVGQRSAPTHAEILAAQGVLDPEELANLNNDIGYPGTEELMVNPDVVGVLTAPYEESLQIETTPPNCTFAYSVWLGQAVLSSALSLESFREGKPDVAASFAATGVGSAAIAYGLDRISNGTASAEVRRVIRRHCPPVYSPAALQSARLEAIAKFAAHLAQNEMARFNTLMTDIAQETTDLEFDENAVVYTSLDQTEGYTRQGVVDRLGSSDETEIALRVNLILRHAEQRFLTKEELETLRITSFLMEEIGRDPDDFCMYGENQAHFMQLLVDEYESGKYPYIDYGAYVRPSEEA